MSDLIRDTTFGHAVRLFTRNRVFQYREEKDPKIWKQYLDREQTMNLAQFGHASLTPEEQEKKAALKSNIPGADAGVGAEGETSASSGSSEVDAEKVESTRQQQLSSTITGQAVDAEKGRDVSIIGWYGDDDPENPQNWSSGKKAFVTFLICFLTFSVYIGSAIYTAGTESIIMEFGVSQTKATLGLTLFVLGYALGPSFFASAQEMPQIGRNPVYIGTLIIFVIFQVPTALATNFAMLLAFRFFTGFFGSPVLATGGATIADMYAPRKRAYGIGLWGVAAVCGPVLGPLVGGFAAQAKDWTWTIWELMWLSGFALIVFIFFLPETSEKNILYRRTRRVRKLTGITSLKSQSEIDSEGMTGREVAMIALVRPFTLNFWEPILLILNLYIALVYALLYLWFESFPVVFIEIYHFNLGQEGLAFIGVLVGAIVVIPPFFYYLYKYVEPQFAATGQIKPEIRLQPACVGAFCIPICLFWFGWSARSSVHWIMPIIGSGWFTVGAYLLFNSVLNYIADAYPEYAASALAGNDLMRSAFGAAFPLFGTGMYHNLGVGWASTLLAFLSIAFIPAPFLLLKYGERIRKNSKHARQDF